MAIPDQQGERWATQNVLLEGGLYLDKDAFYQAAQMPGSAIKLINFEPSLDGGYHRILGYKKFDAAQPSGTNTVLGVIVNPFDAKITAMVAGNTYQSAGSGWSRINGADVHSAMGVIQSTKYNWATNRVTFVDGDPNANPVRLETGGVYTVLTNAPKGQKFIQEFSGYLWMSDGTGTLTFSAPQNDNDYNAIDGAGSLNVGFPIVGLGVWRGALYIFGQQRISQVTGTSLADWQVTPLTDNIGMTGIYSLQEVNGDLVFMSSDGLRTISGTARIFDRELGVISRPINTFLVASGSQNLISGVVKSKSQYRLFQGTGSTATSTYPGVLGTLKLQTNGNVAWEWSKLSGIPVSSMDNGLINGVEVTAHGSYDGYVYEQENGTDFNGTAIQATYQTPFLIYNDSGVRKILYKLQSDFKSSGSAMITLGTIFDYGDGTVINPPDQVLNIAGGSAVWDSGVTWDQVGISWDVSSFLRVKANLVGSCFSSSLVFTSSGGADYSLQAYSIQYGIGARR